jgi:type II secretory ATPase GspE/PulE/Tfp pilus assembly ATPase PilB-like protein
VRVLCPKCKVVDPHGVEELRARVGVEDPGGSYALGRGCEFCNYTGYRGRVALFEIAEMTDALRHLVITRAPHHELTAAAQRGGMTMLLADGLAKAAVGVTSLAEVWRVVSVDHPGVDTSPDDGLPEGNKSAKTSGDESALK